MKYFSVMAMCLLSGCSYCDTVIYAPTSPGTPSSIRIDVNQGRKGLDSLFDGVQANVPLQGSTVSAPTNTKTAGEVKK